MKRKFLFLSVLIATASIACISQNPVILTVNQSDPLVANAGEDVQIVSGESIKLGGDPSASNGYEGYIYLWSPSKGLDDPTLPNPMATPGETTTYLLTVTDANNCSATDEATITLGTSGLKDINSSLQVRCYPNPVSDELRLEITGSYTIAKLRLISPLGKVIKTIELRSGDVNETRSISMKDLPAGIYLVHGVSDESTVVQSIIKTR